MRRLLRSLGIAVLGVALTTGVVSAATGTIDTTGPDSVNDIEFDNHDNESVNNSNGLSVTNNNPQTADSGDTEVHDNGDSGSATTGAAANDGTLDAALTIDNSSSGAALFNGNGENGENGHNGSIANTGPNSSNNVLFDSNRTLTTTNTNSIVVTNNNAQTATTGNAFVYNNTTGGDATSGDASNTSSATFTISVTN